MERTDFQFEIGKCALVERNRMGYEIRKSKFSSGNFPVGRADDDDVSSFENHHKNHNKNFIMKESQDWQERERTENLIIIFCQKHTQKIIKVKIFSFARVLQ